MNTSTELENEKWELAANRGGGSAPSTSAVSLILILKVWPTRKEPYPNQRLLKQRAGGGNEWV